MTNKFFLYRAFINRGNLYQTIGELVQVLLSVTKAPEELGEGIENAIGKCRDTLLITGLIQRYLQNKGYLVMWFVLCLGDLVLQFVLILVEQSCSCAISISNESYFVFVCILAF
ncbi:MAG: hypothetical protein GEU26_09530 [Nitrososphaeraceae archaeon]|nr:hypothetical protein [Nitrososphaeraceae archaeon]